MPNTGTVVPPGWTREAVLLSCYLSHLLPQHSQPFAAQSCQVENVINFSHVAIDPIFIENIVLFQKSSQSSPTSLPNISSNVKRAVISQKIHVKLSTAHSAWQPELFLYKKIYIYHVILQLFLYLLKEHAIYG